MQDIRANKVYVIAKLLFLVSVKCDADPLGFRCRILLVNINALLALLKIKQTTF